MARHGYKDEVMDDQFPVWEPDGQTKKSGESSFTVTIYKDGVVQAAYAYTITEIGSLGVYKFTFTPDDTGFWFAEVFIPYNSQTWVLEADIEEAVTLADLKTLLERALGLMHENIFIDETVHDIDKMLLSCRVRLFASKTDADAATDGGNPPPGGTDPQHLWEYTATSVWDAVNELTTFRQVLEP